HTGPIATGVQGAARPLPADKTMPIGPTARAEYAGASPARPATGRPRQRTGPMRVPPPPARAARAGRGGYYAPPAARTNRDDLGCATWLVGSAILIGIVGLIFVAFRLGPGVFSGSPDPTPTVGAGVIEPTAT